MRKNRLNIFHSRVLCALFMAAVVFQPAASVLAQDWRFEPVFRLGGEYDENSTLNPRTDLEEDISGILLDVRADIYYKSPLTFFFVQPKVVSRNYNTDNDFDSEDFFLQSDFRRETALNTFGFGVNFDHQSVRTGERSDADLGIDDPDDIIDDDTGRVLRFGDRSKWRVSPYWQYQLSTVSSIGFEFDYKDTQYDDQLAGFLTDFSDARLDLNYRRSLSNVTTWGISVAGRRYDSDNLAEVIDGFAVSAEIDHALSEKTRLLASIGLEDTDVPGSDTDPEGIGSVTFIHNLETIRLLAQYQRSVSGGGAGRVSVRDSLNLNFRRRLSERISAGLGVRAYQSQNVSGTAAGEDRSYVLLQSTLDWYLTRSFVIEADYRYTVQDRSEAFGESANSNQINLWFVYQPKTVPKL